ncbi:hypothetical protein [Quadrisphaera setariae]|uniref:Uncharacterized protein n=1 Tax=Quadrisphaera setariae TaxID=2593304 RepID=A0A5C8ZEI5_9ACTN|nr:hypothetical protein [Quadrisphaera setariae]TXR56465.1 hypothetical protein FMM08_10280 [Quadrisphaera setariae]
MEDVKASGSDDLRQVAPGLKVPSEITVDATLPDEPGLHLHVVLRLHEGRYVAREVSVTAADGRQVSGEALRRLPLAAVIKRGVSGLITSKNLGPVLAPNDGDERSDEAVELRMVALRYRVARLLGEAPNLYIADALGVSRATAARRVAAARAGGYLRPDEVATAGGAPARWGR